MDETPNGGCGRGCVGEERGINADDPSSYLQRALDNQGLEYLGTDGNWYHESVLTEFFRGGALNPNFNEEAARMTHIPISGGN